jgi:thiol:disulfide interchange protein
MIDWQSYDRGIVRSQLDEGRPVLIKFTAKWCTNCHYLERTVYSDPEIAAVLAEKDVAVVKADTTSHSDPATEDLKSVYNEPGSVPVSILITPDGDRHKLRGVFDKKELLELLDKI